MGWSGNFKAISATITYHHTGTQMNSTGQRIIRALHQLDQFMPGDCSSTELAQNVLTGVKVEPVPDPDGDGDGMLYLTFPGGKPMTVNGRLYLDLQIIESARLEVDSEEGTTKASLRNASLSEHLYLKHDLN